jgi:nicotinamidase-related amidase
MLNDFVDGRLANPASKPVVDVVGGLVEDARGRDDWVVVYVNDAHQPGDLEFAVFGEHAVAGTPGAVVVDTLSPEPADVVVGKRYYSAFTETDFASTCLVRGIDRLVLTGQHTDCCCRHTAYDAFRHGLSLAVVSDGTCVFEPLYGDDTPRRQDEALRYLRDFYRVEVLDAHAVS